MDERPDYQNAKAPTAGRTAPPVRPPLTSDQQPATRADLYAAVDALRGEMHELLDQIRTLIREATSASPASDPERVKREADEKLHRDW
ncbi:hypothetical protein [Mycobacterium lacus]|uniref:Uncharacterized protein n=1 Tax=Mycobacterium lacus TaxID=169765 RepID=A0A7I7NRB5_9MYCO|nr:hypothetical protein [Mycobacterium lacus]MCV7124990.1 hypothetical protein [Mycobacterium lacus]BBX99206.1 hypothetical protein MLAC_45000 [Mycobacterium lacus]